MADCFICILLYIEVPIADHGQLFLPARKRGNSYGNVAGWVAGWLAGCYSRYCIKTTKPILKLFGPPGSPIISAFRTPYADTKFQGEPLHRGR